jgi:hypothetical protein
MKTFREYINENKFHPIDVFKKRFVITDGKDIFSPEDGEVRSIEQFKKDMKDLKKYNKFDYIYFPTEKMAKDAYKKAGFEKPLEVKELSYNK